MSGSRKSLQIGNFDSALDLRRNSHNWDLMKSFDLTRQYLDFLPHLGPSQTIFSGVPPGDFDWPGQSKQGVLPTHPHAAFATKSIFDFFNPKSLCNIGKFGNLTEISLNHTQSFQNWDVRGIELFSAIGKAVPRLRVLDLSDTLAVSGELLIYLVFQDAFQLLHQYMYLHKYRVMGLQEREELLSKTGLFRTVTRDLDSEPIRHTFSSYCPWCLDEGAYHDNLRPGCGQEFLPVTVVDDRLYDFVESLEYEESLKCQALLHCVRVSDLLTSLHQPARILLRDSPLLPYEEGFLPEPGTDHLAEIEGTFEKPSLWYPPATIAYQEVEDEAYGLQRTNPLAATLQVIRLPAFSRSLWGELMPFLLQACPNLKSLGKASATMYGLQLLDGTDVISGLQEVFLHLDLLGTADYRLLEVPGYGRLGHGDTVSQNSPSLRFLVQNFGPKIFETVLESDDEATLLKKELALEVWDQAKLLLPPKHLGLRLTAYLDLLSLRAPQTRALNILALSKAPELARAPWERLQGLKYLSQLSLQVASLAEFAGLLQAVGGRLEKVEVSEMIGERSVGETALVEGLDLEEQGGLFVCEKCPNAVILDIVNVSVTRKFYFGRRLLQQPGHFNRLQELAVGKVDWETLKQVWGLVTVLKKLSVIAIVPMFTLHEQGYEEVSVLTILQVRELQRLNASLHTSLEELQVKPE